MKQLAKHEKRPILFLDAGALLFQGATIPADRLAAQQAKADGIIKAVQAMGLTAAGIAPQDLAGGIDYLVRAQRKTRFPWLSMNLVRQTDRRPLFAPFIITKTGSTRVAVLGLTGRVPGPAGNTDGNFMVLPWQDVLRDTLAKVRDRADMVILLSSYPCPVNERIARRFHGIHLIIQSGHATANLPPKQVDNTLICQVGAKGGYLGRMDIRWNASRRWRHDFSGQLRTVQDRLDRTNWLIKRNQWLKRHSPRDRSALDERYRELLDTRDQLRTEIRQLQKRGRTGGKGLCAYTNSFISIRTTIPEDRAVEAIIVQAARTVNRINRKRLQRQRQQFRTTNRAGQGHANNPDPGMAALAGWQTCRACHPEQTAFWLKTGHARAWQTLAAVNQQFNLNCLVCHVTLPADDKTTGYHTEQRLALLPSTFNNVGCEACHGPGKKHARQPKRVGMRQAGAVVCLTCHTPDHDNNFDFKHKLKKIRCPAPAA